MYNISFNLRKYIIVSDERVEAKMASHIDKRSLYYENFRIDEPTINNMSMGNLAAISYQTYGDRDLEGFWEKERYHMSRNGFGYIRIIIS